MSCAPPRPCGEAAAALGLVPPPPGLRHLRRRVGEWDGFRRELIAAVERTVVDGEPLGLRWDVEGDPRAELLAELWAYVAEGVAAYSELTAAEAYLGTASDWTDLSRLAALVGFRPQPRVAAQGWVRAEVDPGAEPVVPAGTRVQAPGTPARPAQVFEVSADTALRSDWDRLTATWVPEAAAPAGRDVRFLGDPGFRLGDRVLFVEETPPEGSPVTEPSWDVWGTDVWLQWWTWLLFLLDLAGAATPLAVASVVARRDELGTAVVTFDRDVAEFLTDPAAPYAAYRITDTAASARRLAKVVRIPDDGDTAEDVDLTYGLASAIGPDTVILDAALDDLSLGQLVAVVDWSLIRCDVVRVTRHEIVEWEVAPGTPSRASKLTLAPEAGKDDIPSLDATHVTVHVLDRRVVARHYVLPADAPGAAVPQLRLHPRPAAVPPRVALRLAGGWEVFACVESAEQEELPAGGAGGSAPGGLIVDLDRAPSGALGDGASAEASANLLRVRHGATTQATLGSGDAPRAGQRMTTPDAPIAYDLDEAGAPVPTMILRVAGVQWPEVPSLYGAGPAEVHAVRLGPDGSVTVAFGDGDQGARLPTGRGNVAATYRVGGGTAGEVESEAIDALLGSVRGVKRVSGAGPTSGGADQDDEGRIRSLAPRRARAFGRAVSAQDLVDLALGYPGVTHAAAWHGAGPPGHPCGATGLHLAVTRASAAGPRAPLAEEVASLAAYLDARRDATVPLCVCAGVVTAVAVTASLAVDPRRDAAAVAAAAATALLDPLGPLAPAARALGEPLDRSDLLAVIHGAEGVVGVAALDLPGAGELGRRAAERWELLVLGAPAVTGAAA